jgi:cytochrome c
MSVRAALVVLAAVAAAACGEGDADPVRANILAATGGDPAAGKSAMAAFGCGSCHVIPGVPRARGMVGPPLTDVARRTYIAGRLANSPAELARWIRWPDSIAPGTAMPTLGVSEQQARDITAYLYLETSSGGLGPGRLFRLPH